MPFSDSEDKKPLKIPMDFDEAMRRAMQVDPKRVREAMPKPPGKPKPKDK